MKLSPTYRCHRIGFSVLFLDANFQKTMYIFAIVGDNGESIAKPSCRYISVSIVQIDSTQNVNIAIKIFATYL